MKNGYTIVPDFVETDWGPQWIILMRKGGSAASPLRLVTAHPDVVAAACYLLEVHQNPEELARSWATTAEDTPNMIALDDPQSDQAEQSVGARLVKEAEQLQRDVTPSAQRSNTDN